MFECTVKPENFTMLLAFGSFMTLCAVVSLLSGTTYFRRVIRKAEEPRDYWAGTAAFGCVGGFVLGALAVC